MLALLVVAALVLVAGCSGTGTGSLSSAGGAGAASGAVGSGAEQRATGADGRAPSAGRPGESGRLLRTQAVIRTGEVVLTSRQPGEARARIDVVLARFGGYVDSEQTSRARDGSIERSTLVLRVPTARFGPAVAALERVGTVKRSDSRSEDVTTQVIDVGERVRTLQNSLDRLHQFQRRATNVDDLLRYEQEITDRQGELQSLTAQRDYLAAETSMATITVYLSTPDKVVLPPDPLRHAGFLTGLRAGWHGLVGTVRVVLTGVGAALPFGVLVVVLGVPGWLLVRRLRRVRRTTGAEAAAEEG